ncbi:MAG: gamma-glutamyl-gamma-aminobutyrate hydrolase family protein [Crocinitomicaceae bacterium]|nr:gamma-glutamyl-gamma-aminobutyrate hydrolase family protein [Crocinitomicaceae bacterium]
MILIGDCGSNKTPEIRKIIEEYTECEVIPLLDIEPDTLTQYKGVILSGAPILLTEEKTEHYIQSTNWIKSIEKPLLGICFGHQLIGLQFGGMVKKMREDRDFQEIEIFEPCALFDRLPVLIQMKEDHCEFVSVPKGFKLIASSDACFNEAMSSIEREIFGIQFHPEVSGLQGALMLENFYNICKTKNSM